MRRNRYIPRITKVAGMQGVVARTVGKEIDGRAQALIKRDDDTIITRHIHLEDGAWWMCVFKHDNGDMEIGQVAR